MMQTMQQIHLKEYTTLEALHESVLMVADIHRALAEYAAASDRISEFYPDIDARPRHYKDAWDSALQHLREVIDNKPPKFSAKNTGGTNGQT